MSHALRLRELLAQPGCRQVPGVHDGLSALLVEKAGFDLAFLSGASLAYTRFGMPDMGFVDMAEVSEALRIIRERFSLPLIVDIDTGFGNALNAVRTVRELEKAGASAMQMEDQLAPKRCGHMAGKQVIPKGEMVGKLKAALDARRDAATVIIARTDALGVEGFESALDRAEAYVEVGADALFVEAPKTVEQMQTIVRQFAGRVPLVHNLVEGGRSPVTTIDALGQLGYRIGLHPAFLVHLLAAAAPAALAQLKADGSSDAQLARLSNVDGINQLLGSPAMLAAAERYA